MEQYRNRLGQWYDRKLGKLLPSNRLLAVLFCLALNSIVYWGAQTVTVGRPMLDMTTALDQMIPLVPGWVTVYIFAYLFWAVGYVLLARGMEWYSVMTAEVMAKLVCGAFFLLVPTTNVRPELGEDVFSQLLGMVYAADAASNLFPSIHCLESWICFSGLRNRRDIPRWYKLFSLVTALMICASTVLIRQHVIADVIAGILLAEGFLWLSRRQHMGSRLKKAMTTLDGLFFCKAH